MENPEKWSILTFWGGGGTVDTLIGLNLSHENFFM